MSGPKRARYSFVYDPTPTRLADLECYAVKQQHWLQRHGDFIKDFLGDQVLKQAHAAFNEVLACIDVSDPDGGFDYYGSTWTLFNNLYRQAKDAQRQKAYQARLERQRQRERRLAAECRRRQKRQQRYQAAMAAVAECRQMWTHPENQNLLTRWSGPAERQSLQRHLENMSTGTSAEIERKVSVWHQQYNRILHVVMEAADRNAAAVQARLSFWHVGLNDLGLLNVSVLGETGREQFQSKKQWLQEQAEGAVCREDLTGLEKAIVGLEKLKQEYVFRIKTAEFHRASEVWRIALTRCGYNVTTQREGEVIVLQASSFPLKNINLKLRQGIPEVTLNVHGHHNKTACVHDVKVLQAELDRHGMQLTLTDWGPGQSGQIRLPIQQTLSVGVSK